jgi:hypothetical protein
MAKHKKYTAYYTKWEALLTSEGHPHAAPNGLVKQVKLIEAIANQFLSFISCYAKAICKFYFGLRRINSNLNRYIALMNAPQPLPVNSPIPTGGTIRAPRELRLCIMNGRILQSIHKR